ncbi:MAG: DMT family transporter [Saccharofermentanales bacterium]
MIKKFVMTKPIANLLLVFIAAIWGSGFIVTKIAVNENLSAGFITFSRGLLFTLFAFAVFHKRILKMTKEAFRVGLFVGLMNVGGYLTQTIGIKYTTPSNNAFLTSTYIVFLPLVAWIFYRKKLKVQKLVAILLCLFGTAVLTNVFSNSLTLNKGDLYSLLCAIFYAVSIAFLSYSAKTSDYAVIAFMIAIVQAIGGFAYFVIVEKADTAGVNWAAVILPVLYMGILCSFVAQTIQVIAQKHTSATTAGLIMMTEGLFGSVFSVMFGFEPFTLQLAVGGLIIMGSLSLMEVDWTKIRGRFLRTG